MVVFRYSIEADKKVIRAAIDQELYYFDFQSQSKITTIDGEINVSPFVFDVDERPKYFFIGGTTCTGKTFFLSNCRDHFDVENKDLYEHVLENPYWACKNTNESIAQWYMLKLCMEARINALHSRSPLENVLVTYIYKYPNMRYGDWEEQIDEELSKVDFVEDLMSHWYGVFTVYDINADPDCLDILENMSLRDDERLNAIENNFAKKQTDEDTAETRRNYIYRQHHVYSWAASKLPNTRLLKIGRDWIVNTRNYYRELLHMMIVRDSPSLVNF